MEEDETPLVIASLPNDTKYTLFAYKEKQLGSSANPTPVLVHHELDSVPSHLQQFVVPYNLAPANALSTISYYPPNLPTHLRNLAVIDSTYSGTHRSSAIYFSVLLPLLKAFGLAHVYVSTASPQTIENHSRSFSSSSTVIFLAGDTSIHEFVNSLEPVNRLRLTIAAIPTGTGNALSNSIGHTSIPQSISRLFCGQMVPLHTFKVSLPPKSYLQATNSPVQALYSLMVCSWGFHASLVADSDSPELRKLGVQRFQVAAKNLLSVPQAYRGTIRIKTEAGESEKYDGPHSYVLLTPLTKLEKTFTISPAGGQKLHMVQFNEMSASDIMEVMTQAYDNGSHVSNPRVAYKALDGSGGIVARIQVQEHDVANRRICIDGRTVVVPDQGDIEVHALTTTRNGWDLFIVQ